MSNESKKQNTGINIDRMEPGHVKVQAQVDALSKERLIKALADAGHRESALLLKNWGEMDDIAKALSKNMEEGYGDAGAGGGVNMAKEDECHKDDPKHEAKEKKIAEKQKKLAEKQLNMHKDK